MHRTYDKQVADAMREKMCARRSQLVSVLLLILMKKCLYVYDYSQFKIRYVSAMLEKFMVGDIGWF